jgi:PAS domain S-box-containing protein
MKSEETIIKLFGKMPYKPLVEEIKDYAIFHLNTEGFILSWNQGAEKIFRYSKEEIIGQHITILFTPEDRAQHAPEKELKNAKEIGRAEDTRWHLRKDDSRFFAQGITTALQDEDGKLIGYAKIARDDTPRKQMEDALLESEERYRIVAETASDAIISIDEQSTILFINQAATRIFGYEVEQMIGQPLTMLMPEYLRHVHNAGLKRYIETGKRHLSWEHVEVPGLHRDGHEFPLELSFGEFNKNHKHVFIGIARDISARKQVEAEREQLLQKEHQARTEVTSILERIKDGFISVDREWHYTYINHAGAAMAGLAPEFFIGKTLWEVNPGALGTKFQIEYERAMRENIPVTFTEYLKWVDLWLEVDAYPSESGLSVFFRDVTVQKRIEEERERLLAREHNARLQAEEVNRLKDEFLATLSHELRTPLNAILGWSQILRTNSLDESNVKKALEIIDRNARSQAQLIEDLLDVSRIITGNLRLDVQSVDLSSVVMTAVDVVRPTAEAKGIRLETIINPQLGLVSGDADRLQQIVWNLLSNAVKFTPEGGLVETRLERDSSHVQVIISDTGQGIAPEFLTHVFDRFRQLDGSTTRRHGGLGLGLAIVRQLVELHGGTVSVESEGEGQGSTFTVKLPLLQEQIEVAPTIQKDHPTAEIKRALDCQPQIANLRILCVDDEEDSRELLNYVLNSCGAQVKLANSAEEAFRLIKHQGFDVIISDIGMPEEDGLSFIKRVRELPEEQGGNVPAIALTAYARAEDREQALDSGFQMHIAKPIEPNKLIEVVANLALETKA